jgi:cytoskeletal protein RodZ
VGGNQLEAATLNQERKASLGESLVAARQRRGLSREAVGQQTHIPAHYLRMLEDDDYRLISDQLYLLPFLRKYANFLDIDQDETAMRLLHEVQRAENSPSPVRLDQPVDEGRRYWLRSWSKPIMFSGLIAVVIGAYITQSRHRDADIVSTPILQSPQAAMVSSSSFVARKALNSFPGAQSVSTGLVNRSHSRDAAQSTTNREGTQVLNQAMTVRVVSRDESTKSSQGNNPRGGQVLNR